MPPTEGKKINIPWTPERRAYHKKKAVAHKAMLRRHRELKLERLRPRPNTPLVPVPGLDDDPEEFHMNIDFNSRPKHTTLTGRK